jgi:hypothetical protein
MTVQKKQFKAALIKYRQADMENAVWFWVNPGSGAQLSPKFETQKEAEIWFDSVVSIHNETYEAQNYLHSITFKIQCPRFLSQKKKRTPKRPTNQLVPNL